jgi:hypothetical protein
MGNLSSADKLAYVRLLSSAIWRRSAENVRRAALIGGNAMITVR